MVIKLNVDETSVFLFPDYQSKSDSAGDGNMPTKRPSKEEQLFDPSFWEYPADWPRDPPGYVFLARAFDEIGRAAHGERWNYVKPAEPEDPPDDCDDDVWAAYERADEQYERAREQAKADFQSTRESVARMIAEQCELGNLVTAARPKRGGEVTELGQHHWNIEDLRIRFLRCEISLDHPFAEHRLSQNDCWIYVKRGDLDSFLMTQPHGTSSLGGDQYLSPYLRVMLAVSAKMGITAANQPKKTVVVEEIRSAWRLNPLSANLIETMATLIRDPESQRGKAKKIVPPRKA
jgi:hypothetical protein